jgi:thiamine biosynthesis protein ThiS
MITIFINGHATQVNTEYTLQDILLLVTQQSLEQEQLSNRPQHQFDLSTIAVAHNLHIVPKSQWAQLICNENDQIELYNAVAGG